MDRRSIRHIRRLVLWSALFNALVLALAAWLLHRMAVLDAVSAWIPLSGMALLSALVTGLLCTVVLTRALRTAVQCLHSTEPAPPPTPRLRTPAALLRDLDHLGARVARDRSMLSHCNSKLQTLSSACQALHHTATTDEILEAALDAVAQLYPVDRGYLGLREGEDPFAIVATAGYTAEQEREIRDTVRAGKAPAGHTVLPLCTTDSTLGVLGIALSADEENVQDALRLLASLIAVTVERQQLIASAQREVRVQRLLNRAGRALTSTLDLNRVLTRIMREAIQALSAEEGSIVLVDREQGDLYFAAAASPHTDDLIETRIPMEHGIVGWVIEHGEPVLSADVSADPRFYGRIDQLTGATTRSVACVPLSSKDQVIGAIEVLNAHDGQFTASDLALLGSLAPQAAIAIENATLFESVTRQMAELKQTQSHLVQAEKLSAIGELVAGVAHELNNPLTAIVGYAQLLLETCQDPGVRIDPEMREDLQRIHAEAQRSARIVQSLLAFARQQKSEKHPVELSQVLEKTIDLVSYQLQTDNVVILRQMPSIPMIVYADRYQLQQVFLNLITNAHQSMHRAQGGGTLTIRAEQASARTVHVSFADDGPGVPPEIAGRIFDPFFTTKDVGQGSGLGLSICLGILEEHGGRIWYDAKAGAGATFVVELPLYEGLASGPRAVLTPYSAGNDPTAN